MSRRAASVTATHQPVPGEAFVVDIVVYEGFPDMLGTARAEAVRGVRDMAANALETYRGLEPEESDDDTFEVIVASQDAEDAADD
jgi:hypothetical protein